MKRALIFIVVVVVIAGGIYGWRQYSTQIAQEEMLTSLQREAASRGPLVSTIGATGTVRSNQTAILNWQTSGTVERVLVEVGDQVVSGQELALLTQTSLPQNVILAQADLVNAQNNLEDLMNLGLQQAMALQAVENAQQALEDLLNPELQQALELQAIADAEQAVDLAETRLRNLQSTASQADIDAAEAQVVITRDELDKAQDKYAPYADKPEDNLVRANFQSQLAAAQQQYDYAVRNYNGLLAKASETDLAIAEANLATAKAQLIDAERTYERIKDGPNPADVALLEAQLTDAQREWERIKDGPDPDDIAVAEARIAAAQATLDQIHITAPFDGVLTVRENRIGDQVSPGMTAFRLDDLSKLLVDLEVSEVDINQIRIGQEVVLTFDAILGKEYHGDVIEVGLVGSDISGIVNFIVTLELLDGDENVRPGMTSAVNIVVDQIENVILVPNRAVRVVDNQRVVYVLLENGELEAIEITLGASSDTHSEVLDGELEEGDLIVLNPPATVFGPGGGMGGPPGGNHIGGN
jgi:HlyD family secretion protein